MVRGARGNWAVRLRGALYTGVGEGLLTRSGQLSERVEVERGGQASRVGRASARGKLPIAHHDAADASARGQRRAAGRQRRSFRASEQLLDARAAAGVAFFDEL